MTSHPIPSWAWGPSTSTYSCTSSFLILGTIKWLRSPIYKGFVAKKASFWFLYRCLAEQLSCHPTKLFLGFILCVNRLVSREDHEDIYTVCNIWWHRFTSFTVYSGDNSWRLWSWMSIADKLWEEHKAYEGNNLGLFVGAPKGFLLMSLSRADHLL